MLPDPLHPAVVHLPLALALLVPLLAVLAVFAIRLEWLPPRVWAAIVLLQALLVGFGWLSLETGEEQEERVEKVIAHKLIHAHEEAAESFLVAAGVGLVVMAAGLLPGRKGHFGRIAGLVVSIAVLAFGANTGDLGGALVYKHGAAQAYAGKVQPSEHLDDSHRDHRDWDD